MCSLRLLFLLTFFSFASNVSAQLPNMFTRLDTVNDGGLAYGVAVGSDGTIFLANYSDGLRAYTYDANLESFAAAGDIYDGGNAFGVAVGSDGTIFLANHTGGLRAYTYDATLESFAAAGYIDDGGIALGVAIGSDGTIFLANHSGGLRAYTHDANLESFSQAGDIDHGGNAYGIAFGPDGTIFLANDTDGLRAYTYDATAKLFAAVGNINDGGNAYNVAIGSDGTIFLANHTDGLRAYTYDATAESFTNTAHIYDGGGARSVAVVSDGRIFLANYDSGLFAYTYDPVPVDHFEVTQISSPQTAGAAFDVTITAKHANGNTLTSYTGTPIITAGSGTVSPSIAEAFVNGVLTQSVTLTTATTGQTLTFTDDGVTKTSNTFNVVAAALDHFSISTVRSPQTAGAAFDVTITAKHANGNTLTSYTGTPIITAGSGTVSPSIAEAFVNGVLTQSVTLTTATTGQTLIFTDGGVTGSSTAFNVVAGGLDHFSVAPVSSPQAAGTAFNVTITAQDENDNTVTTYAGTATIAAGSGTVSPGATAAFVSGAVTQSVTLTTATTGQTLIFTDGGVTETSNAFNVVGSLHHFSVASISSPQTAGTAFDVTITAQDENDNTVTTYAGTATIAAGSGTVSPGATAAFVSGAVTQSVTLTTATTGQTLIFTDGSVTKISDAFNVVAAGLETFRITRTDDSPLGNQQSGVAFDIKIEALDNFNNIVPGFTDAVNLSDQTTSLTPALSGNFVGGVLASQTVTILQATAVDSITANIGGKLGSSNSFAVNAGALDHFIVAAVSSPQTAGTAFNVTVTAQDENDNTVTAYTGTPTIAAGSGTVSPSIAEAFVNGVLTQSVTLTTATTGQTLTFTDDGVTKTSNTFNVVAAALDTFRITRTDDSPLGNQQSGVAFDIKIVALDDFDNIVSGFTDAVNLSDQTTSLTPALSGNFVGGVLASQTVTILQATAVDSITANIGGKLGSSNSFAVNAGALDHFIVAAVSSPQTAGTAFDVTITAQDENDNTVTAYTGTPTIAAGSGTVSPSITEAFVNGVLTQSVTLTTAATGQTLTFTDDGVTKISNTFNVVAAALETFKITGTDNSSLGNQKAGVAFDIKIVALDSFSNVVTGFTGSVNLANPSVSLTPAVSDNFVGGVLASQTITISQMTAVDSITASIGGKSGSSNSFAVNVGALDHFSVAAVSSPQTAGTAFDVTITAQDENDNTVTIYTGTPTIAAGSGAVSPSITEAFVNGVLTQSVTLTTATTGQTLTFTDGDVTKISNAFNVVAAGLETFRITGTDDSPLGNQQAGVAFDIKITALDSFSNVVTGFTGSVNLANSGASLTPAVSDNFVGGVLASQAITISQVTAVDSITASGGGKSGSSNSFAVNIGSLHHFSVSTIISPQTAGAAFDVTITARDSIGNTVVAYTGAPTITASAGTVSPSISGAFVNGVLTQSLTLEKAMTNQVLTFNDGAIQGVSNPFDLVAAALQTFRITGTDDNPLGNQQAKVAFDIKITALDSFSNVVTGFAGNVNLARAGAPLTPALSDNFVAGVLASQAVMISQATPTDSIIVYLGEKIGWSNSFAVSENTVSVGDAPPVVDSYALEQNYPNPFNPTTNISYSLLEAGVVKLSIFDTIGREVQKLVNQRQPAGKYVVHFEAGNLPSGIYFYRLQTNAFTSVKKMTLLR